MKPSEDTNRLSNVLEEAEIAFWAVVADSYPEAKHGDFSPDATMKFAAATEEAVTLWLEWNADPIEDEEEETDWTEHEDRILLHRIEFNYFGSEYSDLNLSDSDVEHIAYSISQGISEGELVTELENIIPTVTARGYWRIKK